MNDDFASLGLLNATSERIYFDGALPAGKEETRLARLRSSLQQLLDFRRLHPNLISIVDSFDPEVVTLGLPRSMVRPGRTALPAPAFLVPLVLEALRSSVRFACLTKVIPGEADVYCASHVRRTGGLVLTNDSDLLMYDLGADGQVVFFPDMDFIDAGDLSDAKQEESLTCRYLSYHPLEITKRLNLDFALGLAALGFEVERDSSRRMPDLLQRARIYSRPQAGADLAIFLKRYQTLDHTLLPSSEAPKQKEQCWWESHQFLDPRISELVCRYWLSHKQSSHEDIIMHLPFLLDDPTRSSAWQVGEHLRTLAYSILNDAVPAMQRRSTILEIGRCGQRIVSTKVELLSSQDSMQGIETLLNRFKSLPEAIHSLDNSMLWTIIALQDIIRWTRWQGKTPPTEHQLLKILNAANDTSSDWTIVHLFAQTQAVHYSWRILQQLLDFVLNADQTSSMPGLPIPVPEDNDGHRLLKRKLESLPSLTQGLLPHRKSNRSASSDLSVDEILEFVFQGLRSVEEEDENDQNGNLDQRDSQDANGYRLVPRKKSKKARNKQSKERARKREEPISTNPFSILNNTAS